MAFNGKYEQQSQENFVPFMKALGIPDDLIEKGRKHLKSVTEIIQTGDHFKATETKGGETIVNEFTIGEEMEVPGPTGEQIKGLVNAVGNKKLLAKIQNITAVIEIIGDQLVIIMTVGDIAFKRTSTRLTHERRLQTAIPASPGGGGKPETGEGKSSLGGEDCSP
ncbi:fatty acid-binding protein, liver-like [Rhinoraja longicauda]